MTSIAPGSALVTAIQGLRAASDALDRTAAKTASDPNAAGDPSSVVGLVQSKTAFDANLAVIRTAQENERRLLDIKV